MAPTSLIADLKDRYRFDRELGHGGMATVYLADDLKHHRRVAIKVMKPALAASVGKERFLKEIKIAATLSHPHILPLYDSGSVGDHLYYVTPFIAGETLRASLNRTPQFRLEDALQVLREVSSALSYAHRLGVVHRDVKAENILLSEGFAVVADFGIAHATSPDPVHGLDATLTAPLTKHGFLLGTPQYAAPEQIAGEIVSGLADQYSLACVAFEMLAGRPPFVASTTAELLRMHLVTEPSLVTSFRSDVSAALAVVIAKGLSKRPEDRFENVSAFVHDLVRYGLSEQKPTSPIGFPVRTPNNLPNERTRFIGRQTELETCKQLLAKENLVTLTGVGGCGKTRLALRVAEESISLFPDGVWFVDLASLQDSDAVIPRTAETLRIRQEPDSSILDTTIRRLSKQYALLILDNCEHVLSTAAELVDGVLNACPQVRFLATSREGLGLQGEQCIALRSLSVPSKGVAGANPVESSESVSLFVDRAKLADTDFQLSEDNAVTIAEICRRLDGIPLAIELAAARVKVMQLDDILAKLDDRFRLLIGSNRKALQRQQTLREAMQWSYDLLRENEKRVLMSLSTFAGGWNLSQATQMLGFRDNFVTLDQLAQLVNKSLIFVDRSAGDSRYSMLETVRQFAHERLVESGEVDRAREQHLKSFLDLAEQAYVERILKEEEWSNRLECEHDNLRFALRTANSDKETYAQLAGALAWFWQVRSHYMEGGQHLSAALAEAPKEPPRLVRARCLSGLAGVMSWQGNGSRALSLLKEAIEIYRAVDNQPEIANTLEALGWTQVLAGLDEASRATFEECLRLRQTCADFPAVIRAKVGLGQVLVALKDLQAARLLSKEILSYSAEQSDLRSEHFALHFLADCDLMEGRCTESLAGYQKSLALARKICDRVETGFELQGVAMSFAGLGDAERALRLAGSVSAEWDRLRVNPSMRFWDDLQNHYFGLARASLGIEQAERSWETGRATAFDSAIEEALR